MGLTYRNTNDAMPMWLRLFLLGPTRSGKTVAASSFPDTLQACPPNEDSWKTLKGRGIPFVILGQDDPMKVMQDMDELCNDLISCYKRAGGGERGAEELHKCFCKTIIIESLSHYSDACVAALTGGGKSSPDQRTWGMLRNHLLSIRDRLFQLPIHVIMTSLEKVTTDQQGNITSAGPRVTGSAGELLPSSCDLIGITEQTIHSPPKYMVHFRRFGHFEGGTRLAGMPPCSIVSGNGITGPTLFDQLQDYVRKTEQLTAPA